MIPDIEILTQEITEMTYPSNTYKIAFNANIAQQTGQTRGILDLTMTVDVEATDRINGYIDDLNAVIQAAYLILSTERYEFIIYSWDYGVELVDLIGQQMPYVMSELPRRIQEALTMDDRIEDVKDFEFEIKGKQLYTTFTIVSNVGEISTAMEVEI